MSSYPSTPASQTVNATTVVLAVGFILAGMAFVSYTSVVLIAVAIAAGLIALRWLVRLRLQFWQVLVAFSIIGFIVLNYGFENFVAGHVAGIPLLIGELLMVIGLALAIRKHGLRNVYPAFRDPIVRGLLLLLVISILHLIFEIPRFGLYALRDASLYFEAVFLLAGYLWGNEKNGIKSFVQFLLALFALNLIYSFTLPFGESLQAISPITGVFQPVPLLGNYQHVGMYLVAGALFCAWLMDYQTGWPRHVLRVMVALQLCGLAVQQNRSMYVGIFIVLGLLFLLGERLKLRRSLQALGGGILALVGLLVIVTISGVTLHGRAGDINADFLREYALSVLSLDNSNRLAQDEDRLDWLNQVWQSTTATSTTLLLGHGFGEPLIDFQTENGTPIRQPHNAAMGVFGRLGLTGLSVWLLVQVLLAKRFVTAVKTEQNREVHDLILWLFVYYVLNFVLSMVQPSLEFSHCAVPLYFTLGFALKVMHMRLNPSHARTVRSTGSSPLPSGASV